MPDVTPLDRIDQTVRLRLDLERANDLVAEFRKREESQDRVRELLTRERDQARAELARYRSIGWTVARNDAADPQFGASLSSREWAERAVDHYPDWHAVQVFVRDQPTTTGGEG